MQLGYPVLVQIGTLGATQWGYAGGAAFVPRYIDINGNDQTSSCYVGIYSYVGLGSQNSSDNLLVATLTPRSR